MNHDDIRSALTIVGWAVLTADKAEEFDTRDEADAFVARHGGTAYPVVQVDRLMA